MTAIIGLGVSELSRSDIGTARELAGAALVAAVQDAGLRVDEVDGLLVTRSPLAQPSDLPLALRRDLGLRDLRLAAALDSSGASVVQSVQLAALWVGSGRAEVVACVFADAPLARTTSAQQAFSRPMSVTGPAGWEANHGLFGAAAAHGLLAQRYLHRYGLGREGLGGYACAIRQWAELNPEAMLREPLTRADYRDSPYIVEPLRRADCAFPVNGAAAVVVGSRNRATSGPRPPVYIHGAGQGHSGSVAPGALRDDDGLAGVRLAAAQLYRDTGIGPEDVQMCQPYDAFSIVGVLTLEGYGLVEPGAAAPSGHAGLIGPGGALPTSTGGGHLAGYYLQGMTPLVEAVRQVRGEAGARQVAERDAVLVTGCGGRFEHHAALVVGSAPSLK